MSIPVRATGLGATTVKVAVLDESAQLSNAFRYRWPDPGCGGRHDGVLKTKNASRVPQQPARECRAGHCKQEKNKDTYCNVNCTPPDVFRAPISVGPGTLSFTIADHGTVLVTKSVQVTTAGPVVSTITPPCAAFDGGSLVTISGNGFEDGAFVQFGTTRSMEVVVKNPFTMTMKLPPAFGITQPQITILNPSGTSATLTNAFRYASEACGSGRRRAAVH